jgi:hypothetical protein
LHSIENRVQTESKTAIKRTCETPSEEMWARLSVLELIMIDCRIL